jgi:hypothetical protein
MAEQSVNEKRQSDEASQTNNEDERISQALERARQIVKPIVKREMEGEIVNEELLNLRLKG